MSAIKQPDSELPDNLPLLTQVADEDAPDELPTLTEVIIEEQAEPVTGLHPDSNDVTPLDEAPTLTACAPNDEEMQRLLLQLEMHLEYRFTHKLNFHLEQLQQQAVRQAVSELKAELPELLRDALNTRPGL